MSVRLATMTKNTPSPDKPHTCGTKKSSSSKERRFQHDDLRYIDRGQLYVLQISAEILAQELEDINCGKIGHPFAFSNRSYAQTLNI